MLRLYLVRLDHKFDQVLSQVPVLLIEEGGGETEVAHTSGTTDPVNVFVDVRGKIKVDDVLHVGDVKTTGGDLRMKTKFLVVTQTFAVLHKLHQWIDYEWAQLNSTYAKTVYCSHAVPLSEKELCYNAIFW